MGDVEPTQGLHGGILTLRKVYKRALILCEACMGKYWPCAKSLWGMLTMHELGSYGGY